MVIRSKARSSPCDPPDNESAHLGSGSVKVIAALDDDLADLIDKANSDPILAVDSEWNVPDDFTLEQGPPLLQIGTADGSSFLFRSETFSPPSLPSTHFLTFDFFSTCQMDWKLPQSVVDILLSPAYLKVGVGIIKDFSFFPQLRVGAENPREAGLVELMRVGVALRPRLLHDSLAYVVKAFTGFVMKSKVSREERHAFLASCDWTMHELTQEMVE